MLQLFVEHPVKMSLRFWNDIRINVFPLIWIFEQIGMITEPHQAWSGGNEGQLDAKSLVHLVPRKKETKGFFKSLYRKTQGKKS